MESLLYGKPLSYYREMDRIIADKDAQLDAAGYLLKRRMQDIDDLSKQLTEANADAERLAEELEEMCKDQYLVWENAGENSPALIQHKNRIERMK